MTSKVVIPDLGASDEPVTVVEWKVAEGGQVNKGDVVLVVESEKIQHDVEAADSGFLHILTDAGEEVAVGDEVAVIAATQEEYSAEYGAAAQPVAEAKPETEEAAPAGAAGGSAGASLVIPDLGSGGEPVTLVEWKVAEGGQVNQGDVVLVVESEKIQHDVEATASGYLHILVESGEEVSAGAEVGVITGTKPSAAAAPATAKAAPQAAAPSGAGSAGASLVVPDLGSGGDPVTLVEWKVAEGGQVNQGDVVLVVESEKIQHDVEATASGYLHILVESGEEVAAGAEVAVITGTQAAGATVPAAKEAPAKEPAKPQAPPLPPAPKAVPLGDVGVRISPLARKMAEENMIDVTKVSGSGPAGRILKEDIAREIKKQNMAAEGALINLPLTIMGEIDAADIIKLRDKLEADEAKLGVKVSSTDIMIAAVARVLKGNPEINAVIIDGETKQQSGINLALAIGDSFPVIKDAANKSVVEISKAVKGLAAKAKDGKLMPEDSAEATFAVASKLDNADAGYRFEVLNVNKPAAAILSTGGIADRPVVKGGKVVVRPVMTYCLTYDARAITGAAAAAFINGLSELLKNPKSLVK